MPGNSHSRLESTAKRGGNSLLLHVCCGPCAIMPITRLLDEGYALTAWFMNPNVQPLAEYLRRREAATQCAERLGVEILYADAAWDITAWLRAVAGRDEAPARCAWCCESRVEAALPRPPRWDSPTSAPVCSTPAISRMRVLLQRAAPWRNKAAPALSTAIFVLTGRRALTAPGNGACTASPTAAASTVRRTATGNSLNAVKKTRRFTDFWRIAYFCLTSWRLFRKRISAFSDPR